MNADIRKHRQHRDRKLIEPIIPENENIQTQMYESYKRTSSFKTSPLKVINTPSKSPLRGSTATPIMHLDDHKSINISKTKMISEYASPLKQVDKNILKVNQTACKPSKKVITSSMNKSLLKTPKHQEKNISSSVKKSKTISSKNEISSTIYKKFSPIDITKFSPLLSEQKQTLAKSSIPDIEKLEIQKIITDSISKFDINNVNLADSHENGSSKFNEYDNIINTLKKFTLIEKDLEIAKQDLALKPDFNLNDFFKVLDNQDNGALTSSDIEKGIKLFDICPTEEELRLIVNKCDKDGDELIQYSLL